MEAHKELSKKTTMLFPPDLHDQLERLAKKKGLSLGEMVREACRRQYGLVSKAERLGALELLSELGLPVGTPLQLKKESVVDPHVLMDSRASH